MTGSTPSPTPDGPPGRSVAIDWAAALAEHDRWLRTAVLARLGERQAVDEVMQEVALAAVAQRAPLADPSKVGAWLYRLAIRATLLYRRRCGRQHKLADRFARRLRDTGGPAPEADPLDWLVRVERDRLVGEALARLPRRDAEILLLKYTEGWSYRDLAAHLGLSESAVEARLHRVRRRLRDELARRSAIEIEARE
ncbi:MAG: RNA polymerase sigma factor [Isosphaeraceae bacterium]|nr:RNA polymerase sigma factor [Isosphaeraceae bacterium]